MGGLIYSLASNAMIQTVGLRWAFRILGIVAFAVNTVCALLLRDRNKQVGSSQKAFDYQLLKRAEYLLLQGWGFFSMLGYIVLLFSLPNYASRIGLTAHQGSIIGALLNLGQALGRPPIGYFSDSIGRINMAMTMTFLAGIFAFVIWIFADSYGVLILYALLGGTVAGTFWCVRIMIRITQLLRATNNSIDYRSSRCRGYRTKKSTLGTCDHLAGARSALYIFRAHRLRNRGPY